ncbi:MAG: hypothetical protein M3154_02215, partial [Candidatus Eremiobacteraeota bacterium]|nr:hypothetical protein [Candidatus Eremiobacteraeota bacterium]
MRSLLALAATAAFAAPAGDAPAPKVLRQLVYDVTYSARTTHEVKSSGLNSGYGGGSGDAGVASGSGAATQLMNGDNRGRLTIAVIAATQDGGLVVDASFAGAKNTQPTTRVAVYADGRLAVD